MTRSHESGYRRDLVKFACFIMALVVAAAVFLGTPGFTVPTLCSIVLTTLLTPLITSMERKGFSRKHAILVLFLALGVIFFLGGALAAKSWQSQWVSLQQNAPDYFSHTVNRITLFEDELKLKYPFLHGLNLAESLSNWGNKTGSWFAEKLPGFMSTFLGCIFMVPLLTFCFLIDGRTIRRKFFSLVPNRFFESVYIVTHGVSSALSDYLRAKLIEALLVGAIVSIGLGFIHSQYAIVLGIWAGVSNIVPYVGPFLGLLPAVLIAGLDPQGGPPMIIGTSAVFGVAFMIDSVVIFPGVVAKLVKLNPLVLTASVVLGNYYFGIIGMLVSIPIAAALKVVFHELYFIIYGFVPDP
jgi:putative permease